MHKKFAYMAVLGGAVTLLAACGGGGGNPGNPPSGPGTGTGSQSETPTGVVATDAANSISLTVGKQATIARTDKDLKYTERFQVTVTDTKGVPIKGARISTHVVMDNYYKGFFVWLDDAGNPTTDPAKAKTATRIQNASCANEDTNHNNILDQGEDRNGNGMLDPRIATIASTVEGGGATTDSNGVAYILASYDIGHATWVDYVLHVTTTGVTGATEVTAKVKRGTGFLEGDQLKATNSFLTSPYGRASGCDNTN